jgi:hypothetical protein
MARIAKRIVEYNRRTHPTPAWEGHLFVLYFSRFPVEVVDLATSFYGVCVSEKGPVVRVFVGIAVAVARVRLDSLDTLGQAQAHWAMDAAHVLEFAPNFAPFQIRDR